MLRQYQQRFHFILVDEYQDTNVAQYLWLRLLGQGTKNICCVGDDDQSIYGWRGAEVDNILRFEHDFPGAKVIRLERNYRSTGHILGAASHLIAHNEGRLGKTLRTEDEPGEKVAVTGAGTREEEARAIGEEIEQLQRERPLARRDRHPGARLVPDARIRGPLRHARPALSRHRRPALLRARRDPRRARLSAPRQPAGRRSRLRAHRQRAASAASATPRCKLLHAPCARKRRMPLLEAARAARRDRRAEAASRAARCAISSRRSTAGARRRTRCRTRELAEIVLDESGYTEMWQKDRSADAAGRLENLKELVRSMEEFENLQGFLEHISLVMDTDSGEGADAVSIMTLHSAKGLEFDTVFLPGWEEGLLPHQRSLDEQGRAGLEEERRLAHVGLTRARRRAKIYFAVEPAHPRQWSSTIPSRFLDELPEAHVEVTEAKGGFGGMRRELRRLALRRR